MEPNDFLDPNKTVYKYEQVITQQNLKDFMETLLQEYDDLPMYMEEEKAGICIAIKTLDTLATWIAQGKPSNFNGYK